MESEEQQQPTGDKEIQRGIMRCGQRCGERLSDEQGFVFGMPFGSTFAGEAPAAAAKGANAPDDCPGAPESDGAV